MLPVQDCEGKTWNTEGQTQDAVAVIPDRSYAGVYQSTIDFCKTHGGVEGDDGKCSECGVDGPKAEEYGSHDKTFQVDTAGHVAVIDASGKVIMSQEEDAGDLFRCAKSKTLRFRTG